MHANCQESLYEYNFPEQNYEYLPQNAKRMMGYVEPAYHPAPFDTRVQAGAPPVYEKVMYQVNERNVKKTFEKLRQSYEIENLAASLTEPTVITKSSRRRRWNQDPNDNGNTRGFQQSTIMFPPIMIKSESEIGGGGVENQEFLEGLIAPPIIPVTRRHSHSNCEIDGIFSLNTNSSQEMPRTSSNILAKSSSSISSIIGDATTVRSANSGNANEKAEARSSQSNLNRIRAFIEVN